MRRRLPIQGKRTGARFARSTNLAQTECRRLGFRRTIKVSMPRKIWAGTRKSQRRSVLGWDASVLLRREVERDARESASSTLAARAAI
jgi:hypothetical protein